MRVLFLDNCCHVVHANTRLPHRYAMPSVRSDCCAMATMTSATMDSDTAGVSGATSAPTPVDDSCNGIG